MERGGSEGGFHGYRRQIPNPPPSDVSPWLALQPPEMKLKQQDVSKTNSSSVSVSASASDDSSNDCTVREQDRFMPIANVIRIMRKILPPHAKISDDAKETIQECVSEYISFVTGEANDRCQHEQRKTITAEDVLWAMSKLGFDDYIEPLTMYLHRYREFDGGERGGGLIRSDSFVKRSIEPPASFGIGPYGPAFHMGHHHNGFYGPGVGAGFLKDSPNAGPSEAAVAGFEPYTQCKE